MNDIISKLIPLQTHEHREGFNVKPIIDKLTSNEKIEVETELLKLLDVNDPDYLVVESLAYLKSEKAVPILYKLLKNSRNGFSLFIAASIFEINQDEKLIELSINSFRELVKKIDGEGRVHALIGAFDNLSRFKNSKTDSVIAEFTNDSNFFVSSCAKRLLKRE